LILIRIYGTLFGYEADDLLAHSLSTHQLRIFLVPSRYHFLRTSMGLWRIS